MNLEKFRPKGTFTFSILKLRFRSSESPFPPLIAPLRPHVRIPSFLATARLASCRLTDIRDDCPGACQ